MWGYFIFKRLIKIIKYWSLKFGLSEKHTKFEKIFLMVLTNQLIYLVNIKTIRKIFSNYVCFSKSPKFNIASWLFLNEMLFKVLGEKTYSWWLPETAWNCLKLPDDWQNTQGFSVDCSDIVKPLTNPIASLKLICL